MPAMCGPKPSHRPNFPPEFLAQAQAVRQRRKVCFQLRQRAALVCLLHRGPDISHLEAGKSVDMPAVSVRRWRRRWALGDFSLEDQPGRGRKSDFSPSGSGDRSGDRL